MNKDEITLYPVWSNFVYFIAGIYALVISLILFTIPSPSTSTKTKILLGSSFLLYACLIFLTGIFSIIYHQNTPSYIGKFNTHKTKEYKKWLNVDCGFALTLLVYSILLVLFEFIVLGQNKDIKNFIKFIFCNINFYFTLLFLILSSIFYFIAGNHHTQAHNCIRDKQGQENKDNCFSDNLDAYDILHSNWHIFTSLGLIFWINVLKDVFFFLQK